MDVPPIRFASARGGRIAYQRFGAGHVPIVAVPPAAQNIEAAWEWPDLRSMYEQLGAFSDFVHFDKRGTGASDTDQVVPGIDERVDDLRAVMDDAGLAQAHLFAQSEGGPMTLLFAATYPDRVLGVILVGSGARMAPDEFDRAQQIEGRAEFARLWGTPESRAVSLFAPSRVDDAEFNTWHQRYERSAASSGAIRDLLIQMMDWDVRPVIGDITCPVLVLHRTGDTAMPIEFGREVAELAKHSTLVELEGTDHFSYLGEREWIDHVERFVTGDVTDRVASPPITPTAPQGHEVTISTLGRFAVTVDGDEVPIAAWRSKRARTLVKRLVAARGWPVRREELAELLWPDEPDPAVWGSRLSVQLSAARRVLRGGIVADRQVVALDIEAIDSDLVRLHASDDDAEIVALHAGPFLPEEADQDWRVGPHAEALAVARAAGHRRLSAALDDRDLGRATELVHVLLGWDDGDVIAHDAAVEVAIAAGDPAAEAAARTRRDAALA